MKSAAELKACGSYPAARSSRERALNTAGSSSTRKTRAGIRLLTGFRHRRERHANDGPMPVIVTHVDASAMRGNDGAANRKPQPEAVAFRRPKRLEDALQPIRRKAGTTVAHQNLNVPIRIFPRVDHQPALAGGHFTHGVACV